MSGRVADPDFLSRARQALAASGLSPCRAGEASVVFFDSTPWGVLQAEAAVLLDASERRRAARFRFEHDRSAYVLAHAMWRVVLGVSLGCDAGEVPLHFLPTGQPHLPGTRLSTSLSHSGPSVLLAVGRGERLGVDIERWPPRMSMDGLLPVICTPEEGSAMQALQPGQRERRLLQLWTRKEALLKAFGTGLTRAPATFAAPPDMPVSLPGLDSPPCRALDLALPGDHVGAFAASLEVHRYAIHRLELGD